MNFNFSELSGVIFVTVDIVQAGNERDRENIAALRISAIPEPTGGFLVEGFAAASPAGGYRRISARIAAQDRRQSIWTLIANGAYALTGAEFEGVQK
jgi:hypothetical protein